MIELYFLNVSDMTEEQFNNICGGLSEGRSARARKYLKTEDGYLSAGAGYLLDCALKNHGLSERQAEIIYGANGKPYLKDIPLYFNLSHSKDVVVCALSDGEVGIDVQKAVTPSGALIKKVCTESETEFILSVREELKGLAFARVWTLKESFLKFTGDGLTVSPNELNISLSLHARISKCGEEQDVNFGEYIVCGCLVAVCSKEKDFPLMIEEITLV